MVKVGQKYLDISGEGSYQAKKHIVKKVDIKNIYYKSLVNGEESYYHSDYCYRYVQLTKLTELLYG